MDWNEVRPFSWLLGCTSLSFLISRDHNKKLSISAKPHTHTVNFDHYYKKLFRVVYDIIPVEEMNLVIDFSVQMFILASNNWIFLNNHLTQPAQMQPFLQARVNVIERKTKLSPSYIGSCLFVIDISIRFLRQSMCIPVILAETARWLFRLYCPIFCLANRKNLTIQSVSQLNLHRQRQGLDQSKT